MSNRNTMELEAKLETLGLSQYTTILCENGFEDWETILDITEDDLDSLGFKRGHRRLLQKEIAVAKGKVSSLREDGIRSPLGSSPGSNAVPGSESFEKRTKRRYRWHPRPDPNAPKKPKTAYVNFADHLRSDPDIACLSFVNIAREVGRRWQNMHPSLKQGWENQAAQAMQAYEDQMDAYRTTKQYQDYQDYLETFKKAPGKSARQRIKSRTSSSSVVTSPHRSESSGPDRSPSRSVESPTPSSLEESMREDCRHVLGAAMLELSRLHRDYSDNEPYTAMLLPDEASMRHAISALTNGGGAIVHIIDATNAESLLTRVYHSSVLDPVDLAELCVIAAVGEQFLRQCTSVLRRRRLLVTACSSMEGLMFNEFLYLRLLRIFVCLTMCFIAAKSPGARVFTTAGLTIAKYGYPNSLLSGGRETGEEWAKVYRSLVFLECWLSQTLGCMTQNLDTHVKVIDRNALHATCVHTSQHAVQPIHTERSIESAIQWQAVRIAIIGSEVSTAIRQPEPISPDNVQNLASQLDIWHTELPIELQLSTLLSAQGSNIGTQKECAMLVVHTLYLGALILLHSQRLIATKNGDEDHKHPISYRSTCFVAGEQISRLFATITANYAVGESIWLIIYSAFSACTMLIYGASLALRTRQTNDHDRLLSCAHTCLMSFRTISHEPVAARYLDTMTPVYEALRQLRESPHQDFVRRKGDQRISISDLLTEGRDEVKCGRVEEEKIGAVVGTVSVWMREPFGKVWEGGGGDGRDAYPTPPSGADGLFWFR